MTVGKQDLSDVLRLGQALQPDVSLWQSLRCSQAQVMYIALLSTSV